MGLDAGDGSHGSHRQRGNLETADDLMLLEGGVGAGGHGVETRAVSRLDQLEMKHDQARSEIERIRREMGM